jgi:hypothetical protein
MVLVVGVSFDGLSGWVVWYRKRPQRQQSAEASLMKSYSLTKEAGVFVINCLSPATQPL